MQTRRCTNLYKAYRPGSGSGVCPDACTIQMDTSKYDSHIHKVAINPEGLFVVYFLHNGMHTMAGRFTCLKTAAFACHMVETNEHLQRIPFAAQMEIQSRGEDQCVTVDEETLDTLDIDEILSLLDD